MRLPLRLREWRDGLVRGASASALPLVETDSAPIAWHPGRPCAPVSWHDAVPGARSEKAAVKFQQALAQLASQPEAPLAVSVAVPFCVAQCLCCNRDIHAAQSAEVINDYVDGLIEEVTAMAGRLGGTRDVLQLHLGGGTANELSPSQLMRLVHALKQAWRLPADADMSVECDARRLAWSQLQLLRGLGFRHLRFGVLDLDPDVQQAIGRRQSAALLDDVCELARSSGMETINLELMVGLPRQTEASWRTTLQQVLALAPDRVTLSHYRHRPWQAPAQCAIDATLLPSADECHALAVQAAQALCEAGYRRVGAELFVLDSDELVAALEQGQLRRNLIAYTAAPPSAVIGLGAGAASEIDGDLFWNDVQLPVWREAVQAGRLPVAQVRVGGPHERRRHQAVQQLLCNLALPRSAVDGELDAAWHRLARHAAQGLVKVLDDRIIVTDAGHHLLWALCRELEDPADGSDDAPKWLS